MGSTCCKDNEHIDNNKKNDQDHTYTCGICNMAYKTNSLKEPEHCCKHKVFYVNGKQKHCCDNGCGKLYTELHCCYCKESYLFSENHCSVHHKNHPKSKFCTLCFPVTNLTCTTCHKEKCDCDDNLLF
jgi:hypothetical protein